MCKTQLPLKLLVDADDLPFFGKTKLILYISCPLPCSKNVPAPLLMDHGFIICHASIISINLDVSKLLALNHSAAVFQLTKRLHRLVDKYKCLKK